MLNRRLLVGILILFIFSIAGFFVWRNISELHIYTAAEQRQLNTQKNSGPVQLIVTEQEQRDIAKWSNQSKDVSVEDLFNDGAGLWLLGIGCEDGSSGFTPNTEAAYLYYEKSASLGFAPALLDIAERYCNASARNNVFLWMVYLNLVITLGHSEYLDCYGNLRKTFMNTDSGEFILAEIERIAAEKMAIISKNRSKKDYEELENIADDDYLYDYDYWSDVYNDDVYGEPLEESEFSDGEHAYLVELLNIYAQGLKSGNQDVDFRIQEVIKQMMKDGYSQRRIEILQQQAKLHAKRNYKFCCKLDNDLKKANSMRGAALAWQSMLNENKSHGK